jgi:hypothetical protein
MSSAIHSQVLEAACKRRAAAEGICLAAGDYYCSSCEQECGPDPDPGWLLRTINEAARATEGHGT